MLHWKWVVRSVCTFGHQVCGAQDSKTVPAFLYVKWLDFYISGNTSWFCQTRPHISPTHSPQTKPGASSCCREKWTGSVLITAVGYPQHWGFHAVLCIRSISAYFHWPCLFPSDAAWGPFPAAFYSVYVISAFHQLVTFPNLTLLRCLIMQYAES